MEWLPRMLRVRELLRTQPEEALSEAERLLEGARREVLAAAARCGSEAERQRLLELEFKLRSAARSMRASRARLRAAESEDDVRLALRDAEADVEEALGYLEQAQALLSRPSNR